MLHTLILVCWFNQGAEYLTISGNWKKGYETVKTHRKVLVVGEVILQSDNTRTLFCEYENKDKKWRF